MKTVKIVFQDCPFCGPRKDWGDKQQKIAARKHIQIEKVSFVAPEALDLMKRAKQSGIRSMPFFTDGEKFSKAIEDFTIKKKNTPKRKKKTIKKEETDGDNQ